MSGKSTISNPYGVMNSRGPPDGLHRACGSNLQHFGVPRIGQRAGPVLQRNVVDVNRRVPRRVRLVTFRD